MNISHLLLLAGWSLYCVLHSLLADDRYKTKISESLDLSGSGYRLSYNIFALVSLVAILFYHFSVESPRLFGSIIFKEWVAPIIILFGLTGMVICIIKYFRQLSGISKIQEKKEPILETRGVHRYVRHPLYLFTFVFLTGLFLYQPTLSNLIALTIIITYTVIGIRFEEKKLVKEFGDQYVAYQNKVPMLIPFSK